jgi:hypothetical protein
MLTYSRLGNVKERGHLEHLHIYIYIRIILKMFLKRQNGMVGSGLIWLRKGASDIISIQFRKM